MRARAGQRAGQRVAGGLVDVREADARALLDEALHEAGADARRPSRDEDGAVLEAGIAGVGGHSGNSWLCTNVVQFVVSMR